MTRFNSDDSTHRSEDMPYPEGWEDLLVSYALGDLSPQEEEAFQQLLNKYPELAPEVKAFQTSWESLPLELSAQAETIEPPATGAQPLAYPMLAPAPLSDASAQAPTSAVSLPAIAPSSLSSAPPFIGEFTGKSPSYTPPQTQVRRVRPSRSRRQSRAQQSRAQQTWKPWGGTIAAALMAAVLGLNNLQLRNQLDQSATSHATIQSRLDAQTAILTKLENNNSRDQAILTTLRQPNTRVYNLEGIDDAVKAFGRLLVAPGRSEVALVVENLPPLAEPQIYRLWAAATLTAQPIFCGEFSELVEGTAVWTAPNTLCSNTPAKMMITVDTAVDPPVLKSPAVLQSTLQ